MHNNVNVFFPSRFSSGYLGHLIGINFPGDGMLSLNCCGEKFKERKEEVEEAAEIG